MKIQNFCSSKVTLKKKVKSQCKLEENICQINNPQGINSEYVYITKGKQHSRKIMRQAIHKRENR